MNRPSRARSLHHASCLLLTLAIVLATLLGGCDPRQFAAAPTVTSFSPPDGATNVAPDTPIRITFDQDMDEASVVKAFTLTPAVSGSTTWEGKTFVFMPHAGWQAGVTYIITVSPVARSSVFRSLDQPVSFRFTVAGGAAAAGQVAPGELAVAVVQPADETTDVAVDSDILVQFSRPMVPLTTLDALDNTPPFRIEPAAEGTGKWLNTAIYAFHPKTLQPATQYRVTVPQGTRDVSGNTLPADYTWTFTTVLPAVVSTYPANNTRYVGPSDLITVTFNQPMNRPSVQEHFSLQVGDRRVPGRFTWRDDVTMVYRPAEKLALETTHTGRIEAGALSATGAPLPRPHEWYFRTVGTPTVKEIRPKDGFKYFDPYDDVQVFFSNPMDQASLGLSLTIAPSVTHVYSYWYESNTIWHIHANWQPSTQYTVTFGRGATDRNGLPLDREYRLSFTTHALEPQVYLYRRGDEAFFPAGDPVTIYVNHRNTGRLDFSLYRVSPEQARRNGSRYAGMWGEYTPAKEDLLRSWAITVTAPLNVAGIVSTTLTLSDGVPLPPGLYFLRVVENKGRTHDQLALIVSHYQLTLKRSATQALVWAGELRTGDAAPGLKLTFYDEDGKLLGTATTDKEGIAQASFPALTNPYRGLWAFAAEEAAGTTMDSHFGVVASWWNSGLEGWSFGLPFNLERESYRAFLYTDRSIYRPGQTVYFRGLVRADDDGAFSVPQGLSVPVTIYDSQGRKIFDKKVTLNEFGAFDGQLALAEEAATGYYRIDAQLKDPARPDEWRSFSHSFAVAEYRKPEFAVTVQTDGEEYIHGDTMKVAVDAQYYFGAPVVGAQLRWRVMTEPYYFTLPEADGWYSFTDYDDEWAWDRRPDGRADIVTEGSGQTDAQGRFATEVKADISQRKTSQRFTVEASVVDLNNQEVSNRTIAIIHKGLFYIGLRPDDYVGAVGKPQTIHALTVDPHGEPVANVALDVSFYQRQWYSVKQKDADGYFYWTWTHTDTLVATTVVTTGADGRATAVYTPTVAGTYRIVATGTDERGNVIRSAVFQWVSGHEYVSWRMEDNDRIELVADKREYQPGDAARILVPSPYRQANLLVTIERGKIISHQVLTQTSNSMVITVPVLAGYVPNVYVSVVVLKKPTRDDPSPGFKVGYAGLKVSPADKVLNVTLTPDRETYGPREKATYRLKALDSQDRGVPAEFSLALVDKSVLALTDDTTGSILEAFYGHRWLGVETAGSLVRGLERVNLRAAKEGADTGKGGGGGEYEGLVRHFFPDVAYWNAHVVTDRSGEAVVTVDLPDNLTTWQMRAIGVTGPDTLVGDMTAEIITRKPLLVRPALPRFLVVDDEVRFLAIVHNYTAGSLDVDVTLTASGVTIKDAPTQRVTVPANGAERVTWDVIVGKGEQVTATVAAQAPAGPAPDAVELTLPVYRYSAPEVVATAGQVDKGGRRTEVIQLPPEVDPSQGELTVRLDPSLAAGMREGLKYLRDYPYLCVEQTVSRFLPNVLTYRALKTLGVKNEELERELPGVVHSALQRLYKYQNQDGGWGWWSGERSNAWLTAYALYGLKTAQEADFPVDDGVMRRAADYLKNYLALKTDARAAPDLDTRAYVLYVLGETGQGDTGRTIALYEQRAGLAHYGRAFLLMALARQVGRDDPRVKALLSNLTNAAVLSATGAHWEEETHHYWTMNTNRRTTAIVLSALVQADPQNPLIPNTVRWLMVARKDGRWETTQETAFAVLALTDVMLSTGELEGDYTCRVVLNGRQLTERAVTKANVGEPETLVIDVADLLDKRNELTIERLPGEGGLWYTAHLRYFLPAQEVLASSQGIGIAREYRPYGAKEGELTAGVRTAQVGDVIQVRLTIMAPHDLYYLVVEDWLPAGFEAVDTSLKTTSAAYEEPELTGKERRWWWYYVTSTDLRDEKAVLFATRLPKGTYTYTYLIRATAAGTFRTIPTTAYEMYFPEVWGRSDGGVFTVRVGVR